MNYYKTIPISELGYHIVSSGDYYGLVNFENILVLPIIYSYISPEISVNNMLMVRDKEGNKILIEL